MNRESSERMTDEEGKVGRTKQSKSKGMKVRKNRLKTMD